VSSLASLSREQLLRVLDAADAKDHLADFMRGAWHIHHGEDPLLWNWHLDAICEHLEAVSKGQLPRLVINMPPGMMKSLSVSVYWPAWHWLKRPQAKWLFGAGSESVALRDAVRCHEVVDAEWYQESFVPDWTWKRDQNAKGHYETTANGVRVSMPLGGNATGERGEHIVIDDPLAAKDAETGSAALEKHLEDFEAWRDRKTLGGVVEPTITLMMQRLHEADLSGKLEDEGYEVLRLPAEWTETRRMWTCLGWTDPRTEEGELLFPELLTAEELLERKKDPKYEAKNNQWPVPKDGATFVADWMRYYRAAELPQDFDAVLASMDCTFIKSKDADYVANHAWGAKGARRYLLYRRHAKMTMDGAIEEGGNVYEVMAHRGYPLSGLLVEMTGNGPAVVAAWRDVLPGVQGVKRPGDSKESRANATVPLFMAGNIWLPHPDEAPWVLDFVRQLTTFPYGRHDDDVDAMSQALNFMRLYNAKGSAPEHGTRKPKPGRTNWRQQRRRR